MVQRRPSNFSAFYKHSAVAHCIVITLATLCLSFLSRRLVKNSRSEQVSLFSCYCCYQNRNKRSKLNELVDFLGKWSVCRRAFPCVPLHRYHPGAFVVSRWCGMTWICMPSHYASRSVHPSLLKYKTTEVRNCRAIEVALSTSRHISSRSDALSSFLHFQIKEEMPTPFGLGQTMPSYQFSSISEAFNLFF